MSNKIGDTTKIIINNLLDEFLSVVYEGDDKNDNEKIGKCLKAWNQLKNTSKFTINSISISCNLFTKTNNHTTYTTKNISAILTK